MLLDRVLQIRANALWLEWANRLADQADRPRAELIRDVIFLMVLDVELGQAICNRLSDEQISYNK